MLQLDIAGSRYRGINNTNFSNGSSSRRVTNGSKKMRRMNNLVTLFTSICAFFFGISLHALLGNVDKCNMHQRAGVVKLEKQPDLFLVVLILSLFNHEDRRAAMRDTWLKLGQPLQLTYYPEDFIYVPEYDKRGHLIMETPGEQANRLRIYSDWIHGLPGNAQQSRNIRVKHVFAIGMQSLSDVWRTQIEKEQQKHNDLLLLPNLKESYNNLTEKMLQSLQVLTQKYEFSYLLKVDDDTYVKLDHLLNELVSYDRKLMRKTLQFGNRPVPQLYWGYFNGRANIKLKGQWGEHNYFLAQKYIPYALGGGYILSRKICEYLAENENLLSTFANEDAAMGTWLAPLRHIYRRHDPRYDTMYMPRRCKREHLVLHKRTPKMMRELHVGKLCTSEQEQHADISSSLTEYYYDWSVPPDQCCNIVVK